MYVLAAFFILLFVVLIYYLITLTDNSNNVKVLSASDLESVPNTGFFQYSFYLDNPNKETVYFEGTIDRVNWVPLFATTTSGELVNSTTTSGYYVLNVANVSYFRFRLNSVTMTDEKTNEKTGTFSITGFPTLSETSSSYTSSDDSSLLLQSLDTQKSLLTISQTNEENNRTSVAFGSTGNLPASGSFVFDNSKGFSTISFYLTIPSGGTATFEASFDGSNYFTHKAQKVTDFKFSTTTTTSGNFTVILSGTRAFRIRMSVSGSSSGSVMGIASFSPDIIRNESTSAGTSSNDPGIVSTDNSTTLTLSSGQTFTGSFEDVSDFSTISIFTIIDTGSSELGTLYLDLAADDDGTYTHTKTVDVGVTTTDVHQLPVVSNYFRIRVSANQGTSCTGYVQVIYHQTRNKHLSALINEPISSTSDCEIVRAVITGKQPGGNFKNVNLSSEGDLAVRVNSPSTAFGEMLTSQLTPVFQLNFIYNQISSSLFETFTAGGGSSIVASDSMCTLTNGTGIGDYATIRSKQKVYYRGGQGSLFRFTAVFNAPVANSLQYAGPGLATDAFYIGYVGTDFSAIHQTGGVIHIVELTVTAAATGAETATITLNGVDFTPSLTNASASIPFTAHEIAQADYTGWVVQANGNKVTFAAAGVGARGGSYSFSSTGAATGTFSTTSTGSALTTDTAVTQSNFNIDTLDGKGPSGMTIDPQKGNTYEIKFQWLGFGDINFHVEDPETGKFILFHRIKYTNSQTVPSVRFPHMAMTYAIASAGSTTSMSLKTASLAGFTEGAILNRGSPFSFSASKDPGGTSEINIISYRVRDQFQDLTNHKSAILEGVTLAAGDAKLNTFRIYYNPTSIGADTTADFTNWTYVDETNSIMEYDNTATTHTGGTLITSVILAKNQSLFLPFQNLNIEGDRGSTLTITVQVSATATDDECTASLLWAENN
jgi:hypothetical protein